MWFTQSVVRLAIDKPLMGFVISAKNVLTIIYVKTVSGEDALRDHTMRTLMPAKNILIGSLRLNKSDTR